jgi:hypothetical protein
MDQTAPANAPVDRRQGIVGVALTCFIRYQIDPFQRDNFARARTKRFILREERTFLEVVDGTLDLPPTLPNPG